MRYLCHDVLIPHETVKMSPFAIWREPGHLSDFPKSAIRALQIVELLANAAQPLRAIDVVRALELSPSSTNQLLKAMMDWGYVIFDRPTKRYFPSPRVSKIGVSVSSAYFGPGALDDLMLKAQEATDLSISISACQGTYMQVVDHLLRPFGYPQLEGMPEVTSLGLQVPLIGSCTGAAWLSTQDDDAIRNAIRLCRRDLSWQACDEAAVMERVLQIRRQGYSFGGMTVRDDFRSLSVPLPRTPNGIVLVMCMSGSRQAMEPQKDEIARLAHDLARRYLLPDTAKV